MNPAVNPYESPKAAEHGGRPASRDILPTALGIASTGLIIVSVLHVIGVFDLAAMLAGTGTLGDWPSVTRYWLLSMIPVSLIFAAAVCMQRRRSLWFCRLGALLACIPFMTPLMVLGLPFGVWAAVLLFLPSTAAEFARPNPRLIDTVEL